ncbi:helicase HerA-like domain-containing protein [Streptomyces populi]
METAAGCAFAGRPRSRRTAGGCTRPAPDGRGAIPVLGPPAARDGSRLLPARDGARLFSAFPARLPADLFPDFPETGDADGGELRPRLGGASGTFLGPIARAVRLIRSKGVIVSSCEGVEGLPGDVLAHPPAAGPARTGLVDGACGRGRTGSPGSPGPRPDVPSRS